MSKFMNWGGRVSCPTNSFLRVQLIIQGTSFRYRYSLTLLMHIVAQNRPIDLHNFSGLIPENSHFWVPVKYPSLNELVSMPELRQIPILSFVYPPIYACLSCLSAMILLFFDLKGVLFHSSLELKITMNSIQSQKHLGVCPFFFHPLRVDICKTTIFCRIILQRKKKISPNWVFNA